MKRAVLAILFAALWAPAALAQTNITTLDWDVDNATPTAIGTYVVQLKVDSAAAQTITPTCTLRPGSQTNSTCRTTIPALSAGRHDLTVTHGLNGIIRGTTLSGFDPSTTGPSEPKNLRVTITIVVTQP